VGEVRARESLYQAIREACAAAKIEPQQIARACIGVAGVGRIAVAGAVRKIVAEMIAGKIDVVGDMEIAMEAAFGAGPGVIVIAGTGSIAYGRNELRKTARAGGWGFAISDEGSAHWIGRTAVTGVLRDIDERNGEDEMAEAVEASPLLREMKASWQLNSLDEFVRTANSGPDFAALLPAIIAVADAGDVLAQNVLRQAGVELARLANIVICRLFAPPNASASTVPLAMVGGVFRHSKMARGSFGDEVRKLDRNVEVNPQIVEPVTGALQMARRGGTAT
jgi:N-acetylglucosamine kinase-like BadF-type ATPase